jgi:hypothetical protein
LCEDVRDQKLELYRYIRRVTVDGHLILPDCP